MLKRIETTKLNKGKLSWRCLKVQVVFRGIMSLGMAFEYINICPTASYWKDFNMCMRMVF